MANAYWIKGNKIVDTGYNTHIKAIIDDPEMFGVSDKDIKNVYKKHKEKLYSEGNAREEIIKKVVQNGWIRVRNYKQKYGEYWSIQFDTFRRAKKTIQNFIYWAVTTKKIMGKYDEVILLGYEDGFRERYEASDVLKESKLTESMKKPTFAVISLMEKKF